MPDTKSGMVAHFQEKGEKRDRGEENMTPINFYEGDSETEE